MTSCVSCDITFRSKQCVYVLFSHPQYVVIDIYVHELSIQGGYGLFTLMRPHTKLIPLFSPSFLKNKQYVLNKQTMSLSNLFDFVSTVLCIFSNEGITVSFIEVLKFRGRFGCHPHRFIIVKHLVSPRQGFY